jgi:hypothetical protein
MTAWRIFRWPLLTGALTVAGLLTGLASEGLGDALAWLGLGLPVAVAGWLSLRRG